MELNEHETKLLDMIVDNGMPDLDELTTFTGESEDAVKKMLATLEKKQLITVERKFDEFYKKDFWLIEATQKGRNEIERINRSN